MAALVRDDDADDAVVALAQREKAVQEKEADILHWEKTFDARVTQLNKSIKEQQRNKAQVDLLTESLARKNVQVRAFEEEVVFLKKRSAEFESQLQRTRLKLDVLENENARMKVLHANATRRLVLMANLLHDEASLMNQ